jgi:hypothetical protein
VIESEEGPGHAENGLGMARFAAQCAQHHFLRNEYVVEFEFSAAGAAHAADVPRIKNLARLPGRDKPEHDRRAAVAVLGRSPSNTGQKATAHFA